MSSASATAASPRILIVDDDAGQRSLLNSFLTSQGFDVRITGPAEFAAFSAREIERWAQMVKEAKIDPE